VIVLPFVWPFPVFNQDDRRNNYPALAREGVEVLPGGDDDPGAGTGAYGQAAMASTGSGSGGGSGSGDASPANANSSAAPSAGAGAGVNEQEREQKQDQEQGENRPYIPSFRSDFFDVDSYGNTCFSAVEAARSAGRLKELRLLKHVNGVINALDLQLPQTRSDVTAFFCNESVYGQMKVLMVTGVVRLGFKCAPAVTNVTVEEANRSTA
jgi:hypothetical protein